MTEYDVTVVKMYSVRVVAASEDEAFEAMLDADESEFSLIDVTPVDATKVEDVEG